MKVTVFSDIKTEGFTSMNIYATKLVEALQQSGLDGLEVAEFSVDAPGPARSSQSQSQLGPVSRFAGRYFKYPLLMQPHRAEINHVSDHSYGFLTYFLPRHRTIVTCHDLAPLFAATPTLTARLKMGLWKFALRGTLRAERIIADSSNTRQDLLRYTKYPAQRVRVIYPGLDTQFCLLRDGSAQARWEAAFRQQYQLEQSEIVLHVGRYSPRKNFEGLLQTFAALRERLGPAYPVRLLQVGGTFTAQHQALLQDLGLEGYVVQIPFLPQPDLPRLYNLAAAFVFPSHYEGFGWPPLEAMACGTPVVASNAASLPEVVGQAALTFDPEDYRGMAEALAALLTDRELRARMIERGLARAKEFSWQECAAQVLEVYREVQQSGQPLPGKGKHGF